MQIQLGETHTLTVTVTREMTAKEVGSGAVEVYATPMMVALMEQAAAACVQPLLEPGQITVGTALDIRHTAATPVGMRVTATATVTRAQGKAIDFAVTAHDEAGEIGSGAHSRAVVDKTRFLDRANQKANP